MKYFIACIFLLLHFFSAEAQDIFAKPARGFTSWQPAANWEQALVSGNGTMGALIMGQPHDETIILSHAALYLPQKRSGKVFKQADSLQRIRQLMLQGQYASAANIPVAMRQQQGYTDVRDPFIPAFQLNLQQQPANIGQYNRSVNFETGETFVNWKDDNGTYQRRVFVSRLDSVVVINIKGSAKITAALQLQQVPVEWQQWQFVKDGIQHMQATAAEQWLQFKAIFKQVNKNGIHGYTGVGRLVTNGGSTLVKNGKLWVQDADEITLLIKISPDYNPAGNALLLQQYLQQIPVAYDDLLRRHTLVHQALFSPVSLKIAGNATDKQLHAEELNLQAKTTVTNATVQMLFDAARYNIISSTGYNPPNLQGIWGGSWSSPWSGGITTDGNLPVAISSLMVANTPQLMEAFFKYHEQKLDDYRNNAKELYGCRGIHIPAQLTTEGKETDFGETWCLTFWTGAAGWSAHFFYDYYQYTHDTAFLRQRAYPFMKEAALFYEDFLQTGKDVKLLFNPSYSPENNPANSPSQATINATMDIMIAKELLSTCIQAAKVLQTDKDKRQLWQAMLDKMPSYSIDAQGELDEWLWQGVKNNNHHRHASHLYALYDEVSPEFMADTLLQNAVKNTIEQRLDFRRKDGGGEMAFGLVHLGAAAAHIGDTAHATEILNYLCSNYWSNGLMSYHNVGGLFNTDISGGLPFLITQMLLYSSGGLIKILPALPAAWPTGSITGLLLRGNIRLHTMSWDAAGVSLLLQAGHTQKINCRLPRVFQSAELDGKKITLSKNARNIEVNLAAGKATSITIHY